MNIYKVSQKQAFYKKQVKNHQIIKLRYNIYRYLIKKEKIMEDILYEFKDEKNLILTLPSKNKGKFRWKNRRNQTEYGEGFATATIPFCENSYLEWQIGYDMVIDDEKKTTIAEHLKFTGANGKRKNPYELSEILFLLIHNGVIMKDEVQSLIHRISDSEYSFEDNFKISTTNPVSFSINEYEFSRIDIALPTFLFSYGENLPSIEISIQKQQYATGVQPMLYITLPIMVFSNRDEIINHTSKDIVNGCKWKINTSNKNIIADLFFLFGLCSSKHKYDVLEILSLLVQ